MTNTTTLSVAARACVLSSLVASYQNAIEALIARHPGQSQNRGFYLGRVAGARIGRLRRDVRTKLGTAGEKGDLVLVFPLVSHDDPRFESITFWSNANEVETSVTKNTIEIVG
jgi:hypothetical protein